MEPNYQYDYSKLNILILENFSQNDKLSVYSKIQDLIINLNRFNSRRSKDYVLIDFALSPYQADLVIVIIDSDSPSVFFFNEELAIVGSRIIEGYAKLILVSDNNSIPRYNRNLATLLTHINNGYNFITNDEILKDTFESLIIDIVENKIKYKTPLYNKVTKQLEASTKSNILDLSNCMLTELPNSLFTNKDIETIILGDNTIWDAKDLKFIQSELNFETRNFLTEIPEEIKSLTKLKYFSIGGDYDKKYPIKSLGGLKNHQELEVLDLSFCEFENMDDFTILPKLHFLDLSKNFLTSIRIDQLPSLGIFIANENRITNIFEKSYFRKALDRMQVINLKNNPLNYPWINETTLSINGDNIKEIKILYDLSEKKELKIVNSLPQKLILLGNSEVGKTELAKIMMNVTNFEDKGSTDGLKIREWELKSDSGTKKIFIYDFGGQDFYHSVYPMFFTSDCIYTIIWHDKYLENQKYKSKINKDDFIRYQPLYWFKNIQYIINRNLLNQIKPKLEVISLHNNFKKNNSYQHINIDQIGLNNHFTLNLKRIMDPINQLKKELFEQTIYDISKEFNSNFSLTEKDLKILDLVLKQFKKTKYKLFTQQEFEETFYSSGKPDYSGFLEMLHLKGIIFHLKDHLDLRNSIWINPSTISDQIYKVFNKAKILNKGEIIESQFNQIMAMTPHLKELLLAQEIIFKDNSKADPNIIIPQYLPNPSKNDLLYNLSSEGMSLLFAIRFKDFAPHGLMARLMCRLGKLDLSEKKLYRNEFICKLNLSQNPNDPIEKQSNFNLKIVYDPINLSLSVFGDIPSNYYISKYSINKYLFRVVLAAYWNLNHPEYNDSASNATPSQNPNSINDDYFINYTNIDFEISVDNKNWVDYGVELNRANKTEPEKLPNHVNAVIYNEIIKIIDDISLDQMEYHKSLKGKLHESNPNEYYYYEKNPTTVPTHLFNPFIKTIVKVPKKVFVSYSHDDTLHRQMLQKFLINLQRENLIEIWHDGLINPGDDWDKKIIENIESADVIILLVSQSFIASTYVYEKEMPVAFKKVVHKNGVIFPFILENCDWINWKIIPQNEVTTTNVGKYQSMPISSGTGRLMELNKWQQPTDAWMELTNRLREYCQTHNTPL